jgi:hypothetical protein
MYYQVKTPIPEGDEEDECEEPESQIPKASSDDSPYMANFDPSRCVCG